MISTIEYDRIGGKALRRNHMNAEERFKRLIDTKNYLIYEKWTRVCENHNLLNKFY